MHHGEEPLHDPALSLGATGAFPEGKLSEADEGELKFAIAELDGTIILQFGKPVSWFGLNPDQAILLGKTLIEKGNSVGSKKALHD